MSLTRIFKLGVSQKRLIYHGPCAHFIEMNIKVTHHYNVIICVKHHANRLG